MAYLFSIIADIPSFNIPFSYQIETNIKSLINTFFDDFEFLCSYLDECGNKCLNFITHNISILLQLADILKHTEFHIHFVMRAPITYNYVEEIYELGVLIFDCDSEPRTRGYIPTSVLTVEEWTVVKELRHFRCIM
jgi:hypothetical protein